MNTDDDKFPILVRRDSYPGILSAASAALDLAPLSQTPPRGAFSRGELDALSSSSRCRRKTLLFLTLTHVPRARRPITQALVPTSPPTRRLQQNPLPAPTRQSTVRQARKLPVDPLQAADSQVKVRCSLHDPARSPSLGLAQLPPPVQRPQVQLPPLQSLPTPLLLSPAQQATTLRPQPPRTASHLRTIVLPQRSLSQAHPTAQLQLLAATRPLPAQRPQRS